jgi:hypothetical protein
LGVYTLSNGIAKLHGLTNHEVYSSDVVDGVYDFGIVKEDNYVLHVVPNGTESQEVSHTYYNEQQFSQDAGMISVTDHVDLQVKMLPKENNNGKDIQ